jgi:hypothetical protein
MTNASHHLRPKATEGHSGIRPHVTESLGQDNGYYGTVQLRRGMDTAASPLALHTDTGQAGKY